MAPSLTESNQKHLNLNTQSQGRARNVDSDKTKLLTDFLNRKIRKECIIRYNVV